MGHNRVHPAAKILATQWRLQDVKAARPFSDHEGREAGHQVQRSKGARSFRGQKILKPGHRMHLFFLKKMLTTFFSRHPQNTGRQRRRLFDCQNKT